MYRPPLSWPLFLGLELSSLQSGGREGGQAGPPPSPPAPFPPLPGGLRLMGQNSALPFVIRRGNKSLSGLLWAALVCLLWGYQGAEAPPGEWGLPEGGQVRLSMLDFTSLPPLAAGQMAVTSLCPSSTGGESWGLGEGTAQMDLHILPSRDGMPEGRLAPLLAAGEGLT